MQGISRDEPVGDLSTRLTKRISATERYRESFRAPDASILVVDDTPVNLDVIRNLLKKTDIGIDTAESGQEAIDMVKTKAYDVIFLDHRMPNMDGLECLKIMQGMEDDLSKDAPVISLTANAVSGAREEYLRAGFADYLTKPIDSEKLEAMIIEYLPADKVQHVEGAAAEETAEEKTLPDWLKNVAGLSTADGLKNCGGVDAYLDALTVFAQSVVSGAKEIANFYKAADWKNYTTKVHALKSSARVIGANELSDRARRLEDAGNSGYIDEIHDSTDGMLELYISFAYKLAPLIQTEDADDSKPLIEDDALAEAYETLSDAAANFDFDTVEFVFDSLKDYRLPENQREKFSQIKSAASKPDWEELSKLLAG